MGGTALVCLSHEAEVACVVVDDDLEVGQCRDATMAKNRYRWLKTRRRAGQFPTH